MRTYTLVAVDYDNTRDPQALAARLSTGIVDMVETAITHWKTGEDLPAYLFIMDPNVIRDTVAHGIGCDHGFVCHIGKTTVIS